MPDLPRLNSLTVNCCRCAGTAAGQGVGSVAGMRQSRLRRHQSRSTVRPVRYTGVTGVGTPLLAAWRLHSCPAGANRSTPQLPDGDTTRTCRSRRIPAWCGRGAARGGWQTVSGSGATPPTRTAGGHRSANTTTRFPRPIRQLGRFYIVADSFAVRAAVLYQATAESFTDRSAAGGRPRRQVGQNADSALADQLGEMSIRQIDSQTAVVFNASTGNMEGGAAGVAERRPRATVVRHDGGRSRRKPATALRQSTRTTVWRHLARVHHRRTADASSASGTLGPGKNGPLPGDSVRGQPRSSLVRPVALVPLTPRRSQWWCRAVQPARLTAAIRDA